MEASARPDPAASLTQSPAGARTRDWRRPPLRQPDGPPSPRRRLDGRPAGRRLGARVPPWGRFWPSRPSRSSGRVRMATDALRRPSLSVDQPHSGERGPVGGDEAAVGLDELSATIDIEILPGQKCSTPETLPPPPGRGSVPVSARAAAAVMSEGPDRDVLQRQAAA